MVSGKNVSLTAADLNSFMTADELVHTGNRHRANNDPEQALACYAQAFVMDRKNIHAFNNYGNVLRECGDPVGAIPFLQHAMRLNPAYATAPFNLAVAYLLQGDYEKGWPQYETRWNFEHLANTLPKYQQPRWTGQDLTDKTIFVLGEQGLGDTIQFVRFLGALIKQKARVILSTEAILMPLFEDSSGSLEIVKAGTVPEHFDYWTPLMSIPNGLNLTLKTLPHTLSYIAPDDKKVEAWRARLGAKTRLRVGFCYSGRKDNWLNQYKGMTADTMLTLINRNINYDWICLQQDANSEDLEKIRGAGCQIYNELIQDFSDTAALVHHLDVVISVDTSIAHLSGAMGRPVWIPLNCFATDWRWLLDRDDSPWYPSARLFRQPVIGDWTSVLDRIHRYLTLFKI